MTTDAEHKRLSMILGTVRFSIVIVALVILLWLNATHFDATEIKSIFGVAFVAAAGEGVTAFLQNK